MKIKPLGKKGTFVGYSESSKAYKIDIPGSSQIEVSKYVTFEEEMAIQKGRGSDMEINDDEEMRSSPPLVVKREFEEKNQPINPIDPVKPVNAPSYMIVSRKRPRWAQETLEDAEGHEAPHDTYRESKRPQRFSS